MQNFFKTNIFFFIILTFVVICIYGKSINYEFINLDEDTLILNNIRPLSNLKNIPSFFLSSCYLTKTINYYRPILPISFAIETTIFGVNTKIYHATNIILFILCLYLLYIFLLKLKQNKIIAKFIILIFAVHPIFTTLAVWIPSRNDSLLVLFLLLSFINFINYLESSKIKYLILYIIFFTISLFTKETALILFPLFCIYPYCFNLKITKYQILKILYLLIPIFIVYIYIRSLAVPATNFKIYYLNFHKYINNILLGYTTYIYQFFNSSSVPTMLYILKSNFYLVLINTLSFLFLVIFFIKNKIQRKPIIFAFIFFLIALFPTFLQPDHEYCFLTHRFFISSIGIAIILSIIVLNISKKYSVLNKYLIILFCVIFIFNSYFSFTFSDTYKNDITFWTQAYNDAPLYHNTSYGLAKIYLKFGNYEKYKELMFQAYKLSKGDVHIFNIVPILLNDGKIDDVKKICLNILNDKEAKLFHQLGANRQLGEIYLAENNKQLALQYLKKAYELNEFDFDLKDKILELEKY